MTTATTHRLVIEDFLPARLNELLGHWAAANRRKRSDRMVILAAAMIQRVPKATGRRRVTLVVTLPPRCRGGDVDCYWKSTLDAMKHAGLIVDDNAKWCELAPVVYRRGPRRRTEIVLEDVP